MDFKLVIVVLLAYFIRPQDWLPGMAGTNIMRPLMAVTLIAMFTRRRGFSAGSLVKSPIDLAMIAYAAFIIFSAPAGDRPISAVFVMVAYYFVTSQALTTPRRLAIYLHVWLFAVITVAAMAVMSEYGLDLTGAKDITYQIPDKPRLVLNTYLFNNPNSLGHSVVLTIPIAYFALFWRRPMSRKLLAVGVAALAAYCVFLTRSKGAYIVGFIVLIASQLVGRSRIFQLIAIALAVTIGSTALKQMPRMTELDTARQDEAIMGRMLAWEQARIAAKESSSGQGYKNFKAIIEFEDEEVFKATHSSYVLVGAELGRNGMFFYLAVLFTSLRALFSSRCKRESDERSRRILVVLLFGYMLSGWLIDRSYHLEYFLMAGAVSALHRRLGVEAGVVDPEGEELEEDYEDEDEEIYGDETDLADGTVDPAGERLEPVPLPVPEPLTGAGPALAYQHNVRLDGGIRSIEEVDTSAVAEQAIEEELTKRGYWARIGILDILLMLAFTKFVFAVWDYILETYFL